MTSGGAGREPGTLSLDRASGVDAATRSLPAAGEATRSLPPPGETRSLADALEAAGTLSLVGVPAVAPGAAASATGARWRVGDVLLGTYLVRRVLGEGGMGTVHLVQHLGWNVELAVKSPRPEVVRDPTARARFVREAEVWVELGVHPGVATCHFVREVDGVPRIFIEFVAGGDLKHWSAAHAQAELPVLLPLVVQVCDGMAFAHRRGLVHRDLKPANVLLGPGGSAKITDFGLTRPHAEGTVAEPAGPLAGDSGPAGTPEYMAPEQWRSGAVGPAVDLYAFGVTLYELLAGVRPFPWAPGEPLYALQARHLTAEPPPLATLRPGLPAPLDELVARCLRKRPDERPPSFDEVAARLREIHARLPGVAGPLPVPDEIRLRAAALNNRA
ncbi:MAG: serine/threonine protein kinase, partial [Deltaproteobacteria bacterium]|nr:serine/threonine protein kinase [Deltaproteobacteria bacterium]